MYYGIDAVRWGTDGHISHVRWHAVDTVDADDATIAHTASQVVPVVDAAKVCGSSEVRVMSTVSRRASSR
jgi:xylose isomerase